MQNINFTPKDILQKEFRQKMRGYDPADVDEFLDSVIKDYDTFSKETQTLQDENERLRNKVDELDKQLSVRSQAPSSSSQQTASTSNMDILKRLSMLERKVYGPQFDNDPNESHRL
ncbi:cell division regulator GpsB [Levilactobacillus bambusae]|uniref:Cell cycle protein GpsB n=1 Tax=Levilactobacillus bambusae TaxID=2024736 RepID=A0A2V1N0T3_9LACO|nr:cell division regulator GpsB [Levilactobacillus bambusae]PWG00869.1 cell division regulator GpsB [Levilactobacillus bambusae]